jgi:hypothetical protein
VGVTLGAEDHTTNILTPGSVHEVGTKLGTMTKRCFDATRLQAAKSMITKEKVGGRDRVRTCDPLLAKQVLSQLSYTPPATI